MKTIFLVTQDEAGTAKKIEKLLLGLPKNSGILFVSVSVTQDLSSKEPRKIIYKIVIGCARSVDIETVRSVAETYLRKEAPTDFEVTIEIYRGIDRYNESN